MQLVETPERGDHLLAHLVAVAAALDDLQIGAPGLGAVRKPRVCHSARGRQRRFRSPSALVCLQLRISGAQILLNTLFRCQRMPAIALSRAATRSDHSCGFRP